ncbi:MAG TPA: GGDEF domain-containing protein, partial [Blastocatellia bacterium]|nr:GGDEF domain-containing protein [Blastocatellia bacterium]
FAHYVPVMSYIEFFNDSMKLPYLQYTSIYDLILEILLGFGTVMVVMEDMRHEVEAANRELVAARDRLEVLARIDPLTEALNRHAFHSLLEKRQDPPAGGVSGCVVVIDIDNLKPINDRLGHTAGDAAIREVARCLRSVIRADDLLFRWGGDEFLILLFNISEPEARRRIDDLDAVLAETRLPGSTDAVPLIVSYGLASFTDLAQVEHAIEKADSAMYARKQSRKRVI